ncbi:MAG: class I SAM-dependent methyltransferase [Alphaproteobacteria bacterium]|nr:class I SAM-dependent methyltransferase [Alphaproteobacteria bacterium]
MNLDHPLDAAALHDLALGHLAACQICGSRNLRPVLDLGHQPPCDSLLTAAQLDEPESLYPLRLMQCGACGLAQIDYVVRPDILFHPHYPYRTGITATLVRYLHGTASRTVEAFGYPRGSLAIDIGSNDGTLLKGFLATGMRVLGIEATNVAEIARADGVETIQAFFGESLARRIVETHGKAAIVTSTNMFAHIPNLGDLLRGVTTLLGEGGVFVTESHYLLDLIETAQYDSIYHEHLKYYSLHPLAKLFSYYDFSIVDAERIPNYGGSIRVFAMKGRGRAGSARLAALLEAEERAGINGSEAFARFVPLVEASKLELQKLLVALKLAGTPAPGIGCPGRSSTLLNYCNIDPLLMPYIAEQSSSLKLGLFLPGKHIPIVDEKRLFEEQPEYAVMLSWHYAEPIIKKLRERGLRSKLIIPLPSLRVVER